MYRSSRLRAQEGTSIPISQITAFKAQRQWPPDFSKLDPKHQFRLERRYRRRAKLKWARPRWIKSVKLAAWGSSIFVFGYGVLFMDWGTEQTPFQGIRAWFWEQADSIWTTNSTNPARSLSQNGNP